MPRSRILSILSAMVLAIGACGHHAAEDAAPEQGTATKVEVRSEYTVPVIIVVVANGFSHRLGRVYPGVPQTFVIPPGMVGNGSLELQALPGAPSSRFARSGPLVVFPGAIIDFQVGSQLFNSTATIRPE